MDFISKLLYFLFEEDQKAHHIPHERECDILHAISSFTPPKNKKEEGQQKWKKK